MFKKVPKEYTSVFGALISAFIGRDILATFVLILPVSIALDEHVSETIFSLFSFALESIIGFGIITLIIKNRLKKGFFFLVNGVTASALIRAICIRWLWMSLIVKYLSGMIILILKLGNVGPYVISTISALVFYQACADLREKLFEVNPYPPLVPESRVS